MGTSSLPLPELLSSPLLTRTGAVNATAVEAFATAARDADAARSEADTAARELATEARHAARVLAALTQRPVKDLAPDVVLSPRVWADILGGNRDASPGEALQIAKALANVSEPA